MSVNIEEFKEKSRKALRKALIALVVVLLLAGGGYYVFRNFPVSDSEHSGTLFSLAYKGYLFKTYEGQLHLTGSAVVNRQSVWDFSVKDQQVYESMQPHVGKQVKLFYKELPQKALPWSGKTKYIVYKIEPLE